MLWEETWKQRDQILGQKTDHGAWARVVVLEIEESGSIGACFWFGVLCLFFLLIEPVGLADGWNVGVEERAHQLLGFDFPNCRELLLNILPEGRSG